MKDIIEEIADFLSYPVIKMQNYVITTVDLLLIIILFIIIRVANYFISKALTRILPTRTRADENRKQSIIQIIQYIIYIIFFFISLRIVGVDVSLLLAGSAALLVGIGFGLQNIFNDLVSGILILVEGNVNTGDVVESKEIIGRVEVLGLRTLKMRTRSNITVILPNSKFISDEIINWSHENYNTRFSVNVGVAYGSDVGLVRDLLLKCTENIPNLLKDPAPFVRFADFGESSLDFELHFWSEDIWLIENLKSDLRFAIDAAFRANNITIPFPQRDLHIMSSQIPLGNVKNLAGGQ